MNRHQIKLVISTVVLILAALGVTQAFAAAPAKPQLASRSYVLMDYHSGQVLAEENADQPLPPASLTKMMTSYVISDEIAQGNISNADLVTISENAWAQNPELKGSSLMFIEVNKTVSVEDLHKGIVIQSGNDASIAMAEHIAGSESAFADLMNEHAMRLGMDNSYFINSTGLPADGHVTTARDLAKLSRAMVRDFPEDYSLYAEKSFTFNGITQSNRNELLWDKSLNVDGIKTGHTEEAGYCLVSSATKSGMRLISVVMGTDSTSARKQESKKILNYGFRFFQTVEPFKAGETLQTARVWKGEVENINVGLLQQVYLTLPRRNADALKANYVLNEQIIAPVNKGDELGTLFFQVDGEDVASYPLVALDDVAEGGWWSSMLDSISMQFDEWFGD